MEPGSNKDHAPGRRGARLSPDTMDGKTGKRQCLIIYTPCKKGTSYTSSMTEEKLLPLWCVRSAVMIRRRMREKCLVQAMGGHISTSLLAKERGIKHKTVIRSDWSYLLIKNNQYSTAQPIRPAKVVEGPSDHWKPTHTGPHH